MKRRTMLQGVLAFFGMDRFVRSEPSEKPIWQKCQDAEIEIRDRCLSLLSEMNKPDGYWRVTVIRSPFQHNCSGVYLDHEVRGDCKLTIYTGKFGIHLPTWVASSSREKSEVVRIRLNETMGDMELVHCKIIPETNNANV